MCAIDMGLHAPHAQVYPSLGPFVLMVFKMGSDVVKFVVMLCFMISAFSAALVVLHEPSARDSSWPYASASWSVGTNSSCYEDFSSWPFAFVRLMEAAITNGAHFKCTHTLHEDLHGGDLLPVALLGDLHFLGDLSLHATTFWGISLLFAILTYILMLNMLIAMMAKTSLRCIIYRGVVNEHQI